MKKRLCLRNYIVRGITYTVLCIGAETVVGIMIITTIEKLFF